MSMDYTQYGSYGPMNMPASMVPSQPMYYPVQPPPVDPRMFDTPTITTKPSGGSSGSSGSIFSHLAESPNKNISVPVDIDEVKPKKKREPKPKAESGEMVRVKDEQPDKLSGVVEETPTAYTYMETTNLLHNTLGEIDSLAGELAREFANVKNSKYIKNKYNTMIGLSENISSLLNTKISAIREINSSISKSNDMDFKKMKELKAAQASQNDDKYIADLYQSFINNNADMRAQLNIPQVDQGMMYGSGIIRSDTPIMNNPPAGVPQDIGYLNYMAKMTPEQNLMMYENDPNVKQVVVFDASNGAKFFQYMNTATGQVIPNAPVYDQMFMEDTTLDIKNKIAKNNNLHETFPIVIINEGVTQEY